MKGIATAAIPTETPTATAGKWDDELTGAPPRSFLPIAIAVSELVEIPVVVGLGGGAGAIISIVRVELVWIVVRCDAFDEFDDEIPEIEDLYTLR